MKKLDFLLLFENPARELESLALLAAKLRREGYSVKIAYNFTLPITFYKIKVLVIPYAYNSICVQNFLKYSKCKIGKVINLQWEQVYSESRNATFIKTDMGDAKNVYHIVWGDAAADRLLKCGVKEMRINKTGNIALDLNRAMFDAVFLTKEQLAKKFDININCKWHLFLSSFAYVNLSKEQLAYASQFDENALLMKNSQIVSQKGILEWFEKYLQNHQDIAIIYRPHPSEEDNDVLKKLESKYRNFKCISSGSIRQWIRVSDSISTWISTSIVDVYYAKKTCLVLRPAIVPNEVEMDLYKNAAFISSYEEFSKTINENNYHFPVDVNSIKYFYGEYSETPSYLKIFDVCKKVLASEDSTIITTKDVTTIGYKFLVLNSISHFFNISFFAKQKDNKKYFLKSFKDQRNYVSKYKRLVKEFAQCLKNE